MQRLAHGYTEQLLAVFPDRVQALGKGLAMNEERLKVHHHIATCASQELGLLKSHSHTQTKAYFKTLLFLLTLSFIVIIIVIVNGVQVFTEAEVRASLVFQVSKLCSFMLKAARIATGGAAWDALVAGPPPSPHPLLGPHTSWDLWLVVWL